MTDSPLKELLEPASVVARERIRGHLAKASAQLRPVLLYVEKHLFEGEFRVKDAWDEAPAKNHKLNDKFKSLTKKSLFDYTRTRRMETAKWFLRHTRVTCAEIAEVVGFGDPSNLNRASKAILKKTPGVIREEWWAIHGPPEAQDPADNASRSLWQRVERRVLVSPSNLRRYLRELGEVYPATQVEMPGLFPRAQKASKLIVDAEHHDRNYALALWADIRDLPYGEQRELVAAADHFSTPDFFDLIRQRSRVAGRRDRQRGIQLMELGLLSLDVCEQHLGPEIYDCWAVGHATLSNHHRLAGDLPAAIANFAKSDAHWEEANAPHAPEVAAERTFLAGTLQMTLGNQEQALCLVDDARVEFRNIGNVKGEAECLAQRAAILVYSGTPKAAVAPLLEAKKMAAKVDDPYLSYTTTGSLALVFVKIGEHAAAKEQLEEAKELHARLDYPLGVYELKNIEAFMRHRLGDHQAQRLYSEARLGFVEAGDMKSVALVDLDLALLHAEWQERGKALALASEAIPLLKQLRLGPETLAAVQLLAEGVEANQIAVELLRDVRDRLDRDPLAHLA